MLLLVSHLPFIAAFKSAWRLAAPRTKFHMAWKMGASCHCDMASVRTSGHPNSKLIICKKHYEMLSDANVVVAQTDNSSKMFKTVHWFSAVHDCASLSEVWTDS